MPDLPTYEDVQKRAYALWERSGKPEDQDREFWAQAERGLRDELEQKTTGSSESDRFAALVGDIASRAVQMPATEREAYIALSLALVRSMYEARFGAVAPELNTDLDEHLRAWTEETITKLLAGPRGTD